MRQMGERLAEEGYSVLVVNPFYRQQKAPTAPQGAQTAIQSLLPMMQALNATTHTTDAKAFITWLDARSEVDKRKKIGTIGYCMGGPIVIRTAAAVPDRVGAVGSFHGGGLTTMAADSPHLLIPKTKAQYLIAIAQGDDERQPDSKDILKKTFADAKLQAEVEVTRRNTAGAHRIRRSTTAANPSGPGAACSTCSRRRSPNSIVRTKAGTARRSPPFDPVSCRSERN
jgi:carboxymethylenebutenolidase